MERCTNGGGTASAVDANVGSGYRRCVDPQGNAFFLRHRSSAERAELLSSSSSSSESNDKTPPPGAINWLDGCGATAVNGVPGEDAFANFYADVLSLDVQHRFPFPAGTYILAFTRAGWRNGDKLCGFLPAAALLGDTNAPSQWLVFFATADRADLVARTAAAEEASSRVEVCY